MNANWAQRQRATNRLVRLMAEYVFGSNAATPEQLFGLCKLTWITNSFEGDNPAYIASTKIPALEKIFDADYSDCSLEEVAADVVQRVGAAAHEPVVAHTGFTHFYKAYRNTTESWLRDHFTEVLPLFKAAYQKMSDADGAAIVEQIAMLDGIPKKGKRRQGRMAPARLLTPVFFALDSQLRFPLINGNEGVAALLRKLKVHRAELPEQYWRMIGVYGQNGIQDAADLDQAGHNPDLPDFLSLGGDPPLRKSLESKRTEGNELPLKDEADVEAIREAGSVTCRRVHNEMTNRLRQLLGDDYRLQEGSNKNALFDVAVKNYNGAGDELFVEVKSSAEVPHLRMAVGQLLSYWFALRGKDEPHLAVCLPEEPLDDIKKWFRWLEIGLLWLDDDGLHTDTKWLKQLRRGDTTSA